LSPEDLLFDCPVFAMEFHPQQNQIAIGLVDGTISLYTNIFEEILKFTTSQKKFFCSWSYAIEKNQLEFVKKFHNKSCRALRFTSDGQRIFILFISFHLEIFTFIILSSSLCEIVR
jgi:hypothetical protein